MVGRRVDPRLEHLRRGSSLPDGGRRESLSDAARARWRDLPCWTALHRARRSPSLPSGLRASEHRPAYAAVGGEPERRFDQPQHRDETVFPDDDIRSSLGRKGPETDRSDHLVQCMARFPPLCRRTHPWSANRSGWTRPRFGRLPSAAEQQISLRCLKSSDQRRAQSCQHADG
jgi:hypothetical protein